MILILGFPPRYDYVVHAPRPTPRIAAFPAFASQTLTHPVIVFAFHTSFTKLIMVCHATVSSNKRASVEVFVVGNIMCDM
jgi:hypothetical protein